MDVLFALSLSTLKGFFPFNPIQFVCRVETCYASVFSHSFALPFRLAFSGSRIVTKKKGKTIICLLSKCLAGLDGFFCLLVIGVLRDLAAAFSSNSACN